MKVVAVDDELLALRNLELALKKFSEFTEISSFCYPDQVLVWLEANRADIAFLDIDMMQMDGLTLAKQLRELCPTCAIVFVTGYSQFALQAIQMHASGYLLKPVRDVDIRKELDNIMNTSFLRSEIETKTIRIQCFGNFEVFSGNEPVKFHYGKTKELLAYLIDRKGAFCSNGEIMGILWEDRTASKALFSQFRNLMADLISTFRSYNCDGSIGGDYYRSCILTE